MNRMMKTMMSQIFILQKQIEYQWEAEFENRIACIYEKKGNWFIIIYRLLGFFSFFVKKAHIIWYWLHFRHFIFSLLVSNVFLLLHAYMLIGFTLLQSSHYICLFYSIFYLPKWTNDKDYIYFTFENCHCLFWDIERKTRRRFSHVSNKFTDIGFQFFCEKQNLMEIQWKKKQPKCQAILYLRLFFSNIKWARCTIRLLCFTTKSKECFIWCLGRVDIK